MNSRFWFARWGGWWPYLTLVAEILVFYRRVLFWPSDYVIPWDFRYYHFSLISFVTDSLRSGHFPLWDPYTYCGVPFYANIQAQVFYPPALVTAFAAVLWGPDHLLYLFTIFLILHVWMAGVFTFRLLKALGCAAPAALTGATVFQLGCYFSSQTQHVGAITGGAWIPLSALAIVKIDKRWSPRWVCVLAASLAMAVLAGFPSTAGAAFLCSFMLAVALIATRQAAGGLLLRYCAAACGALALAAVQIIPTWQAGALSVSKFRGDWSSQNNGLRLEALVSLIWPNYFHILDLHGYNLPYNFTFLYLYCGIGALALAAVALMPKRNVYAMPFLILTLLAALLMHGDSTPIGKVLTPYFLTATHDSVYLDFMMAGFSLGMAVLAGIGANRFSPWPVVAGAVLLFTIGDLTWAGSSRPMNTMRIKQEPGVTARQFEGSRTLLETVRGAADRYYPPARLDTYGDSMSWAMMAPAVGVATANGNDPFALIRFMEVRRLFTGGERWGRYYEVAQLDSPILDLLNVRFLISRNPLPENTKWRLVVTLPGHYLHQNAAALPRFFLVRRTLAAKTEEEGLELMQSSDFEPSKVAVVEVAAPHEYPGEYAGKVAIVRYTPSEVLLETDDPEPSFLVTSETDYPGWHAKIDGGDVPIVRTNVAFRGVAIPGGHHRIQFFFRPAVLSWAATLSGTALALMAIVCIVGSRRPNSDNLDQTHV